MSYRRLLLIMSVVVCSQQVQGAAHQVAGHPAVFVAEGQRLVPLVAAALLETHAILPQQMGGPIANQAEGHRLLTIVFGFKKDIKELMDICVARGINLGFDIAALHNALSTAFNSLKASLPAPMARRHLPGVGEAKRRLFFGADVAPVDGEDEVIIVE